MKRWLSITFFSGGGKRCGSDGCLRWPSKRVGTGRCTFHSDPLTFSDVFPEGGEPPTTPTSKCGDEDEMEPQPDFSPGNSPLAGDSSTLLCSVFGCPRRRLRGSLCKFYILSDQQQHFLILLNNFPPGDLCFRF